MKTKPLFALLGAALTTSSLHGADASIEERLRKLETQVDDLRRENSALKQQLGWDGKSELPLVKPNGKENKLKLGGYLQGQGEFGSAPDSRYSGINDRFLIRRARVNIAGSFAENFDFKAEVDIGNNAISATPSANWKPVATDVFMNWNRFEFANVKFGQFKTPFGYSQLLSDTKTPFIERFLANDRMTDSRQIGVAVWGDVVPRLLNYNFGVFNGGSVNTGANDNDNFMYAGRVSGTPFTGTLLGQESALMVGVNALRDHGVGASKTAFGFTGNSFSGKRYGVGADIQLNLGRVELSGEYLFNHFAPDDAVPFAKVEARGFQVSGGYYLVAKKLVTRIRYDSFDPNSDLPGNSTDTWTVGLTYFIKGDDLRLDLNYMLGNAAGQPDDQGRLIGRAQLVF